MTNIRLDFGNLPLLEVAVRASLSGPLKLTYAIVGSLAKELAAEFPTLAEPKQIETAPGFGLSPAEFGPGVLPGAVYSGHSQGLAVSVHPQVVIARWVRQFGPRESPYPRFPSLRAALWRAVEGLRTAVGEDFPPLAVVNMSYTNFVPVPDPASDIRTYLSKRAQLAALDNAHQVRKLEAAWGEEDAVDVRFSLDQGTAKLGDDVIDGYQLTTTAGRRLAGSRDAAEDE